MSHITSIKTNLTNIQAVREYVESLGLKLVENDVIRYWQGKKEPCKYVIRCKGKYDIGLQEGKDGLQILGDFSFGDMFDSFGVKKGDRRGLELKLLEGQNEFIFRDWAKKKKYKVKEFVDQTSGKKILEAHFK